MLRILKRFFDFCGAENKKKFYKALFLGVVFALLEAVKIPAILLLIDGAIKQNVTESLIVLCIRNACSKPCCSVSSKISDYYVTV